MPQSLGQAHTETITALNNIGSGSKDFQLNVPPVESIAGAELQKISKSYTIVGGVDSNTGLTQLNPIKVDGNGVVSVELASSGSLDVTNSKITTGQDVKAVGSALQQVLIYGRKADGTLQPLECNGDRLLVDVVELASSGRITTSTALSSQQVCGFDTTTARFKTLNCNSDGVLQTSHLEKTTTRYNSQSLAGSSLWGTELDTSTHSKVELTINSNATTNIVIYGSDTSGGTFLPLKSLFITAETIVGGNANIGTFTSESCPKFLKLGNPDAGGVVLEILLTKSN